VGLTYVFMPGVFVIAPDEYPILASVVIAVLAVLEAIGGTGNLKPKVERAAIWKSQPVAGHDVGGNLSAAERHL
jgi:hypothetical protein